MDFGDLVQSFLTHTLTVTRRGASQVVRGRVVAPAPTTLTIAASVQPASGRDLLRLPEGRRTTETRVIYTTTQLLVGAQGGANEADLVQLDGNTWEIQMVEVWRPDPSFDAPSYFRCVVQSVNQAVGV